MHLTVPAIGHEASENKPWPQLLVGLAALLAILPAMEVKHDEIMRWILWECFFTPERFL